MFPRAFYAEIIEGSIRLLKMFSNFVKEFFRFFKMLQDFREEGGGLRISCNGVNQSIGRRTGIVSRLKHIVNSLEHVENL